MKDWGEGEKFRVQSTRKIFAAALPLYQFTLHLLEAHDMPLFAPAPLGHTCCGYNESESYRPL